jgi:hypothetical protein
MPTLPDAPATLKIAFAFVSRFAPTAGAACVAVFILGASALIGFACLPRTWRRRSRLSFPLALSLGCTAVGWTSWLLGTTVGTVAILPAFLAMTVVALRWWREFAGALASCVRAAWLIVRSRPLLAVVLALVLLALVPQLLLPVTDSDGLRYHLGLPKLFLLTGHVFWYPYELNGAAPQLGEMLYLIGLKLAPAECAKFLHAGMFVAAVATLMLAVHRGRRSRTAALLAALAFAATPAVLAVVGAAFVDHIAAFHFATALLLATSNAPPLAIGCALAGALGTKLTTAPGVAAVIAIALLRSRHGRRWRTLLATVVPGVVVLLPVAIRNVVATGDPLFPLGHVMLGIPLPAALSVAVKFTTGYHARVHPFLGITWGASQGSASPDEIAGWHNLIALFGLALAVVDRRVRLFAAPVAAFMLLGLWFHPPTRYLVPMFLALAAIGGLALARLPRRIASAVGLLVLLPGLITSLTFVLTVFSPFDYVLARIDRTTFLTRFVPGYRAAQVVNAQPGGGVVMALGFPAPFYFDRPWIAEGMMVEPPLESWLRSARDESELRRRLHAADVRYLVVTPPYGGGTDRSLLSLATSASTLREVIELRSWMRPLARVDGVDVYAVPPA